MCHKHQHSKTMPKKSKAFGLRLTEEQFNALGKISDTTGTDPAFLIRTAIDGLLNYVEASGGKLHLPLDYNTAWTQLAELIDKLPDEDGQG